MQTFLPCYILYCIPTYIYMYVVFNVSFMSQAFSLPPGVLSNSSVSLTPAYTILSLSCSVAIYYVLRRYLISDISISSLCLSFPSFYFFIIVYLFNNSPLLRDPILTFQIQVYFFKHRSIFSFPSHSCFNFPSIPLSLLLSLSLSRSLKSFKIIFIVPPVSQVLLGILSLFFPLSMLASFFLLDLSISTPCLSRDISVTFSFFFHPRLKLLAPCSICSISNCAIFSRILFFIHSLLITSLSLLFLSNQFSITSFLLLVALHRHSRQKRVNYIPSLYCRLKSNS